MNHPGNPWDTKKNYIVALKRALLITLVTLFSFSLHAQVESFSLATDLGLQRSFKKEQRYWAVGHTVHSLFHLSPRDAIYLWISYYSEGNFTNQLGATAKSPTTIPQSIAYRNHAAMRFKHFSLGFRHYLKGRHDLEQGWSLYAYGGFGLMLGRIENVHNPGVDSNFYQLQVYPGKANFKRLTLDLGLGAEFPMGGDVYLYAEGRAWVPTTDYPSKHIFINDNAPFVAMLNLGIRIPF